MIKLMVLIVLLSISWMNHDQGCLHVQLHTLYAITCVTHDYLCIHCLTMRNIPLIVIEYSWRKDMTAFHY